MLFLRFLPIKSITDGFDITDSRKDTFEKFIYLFFIFMLPLLTLTS